MPRYDYECAPCATALELTTKMDERHAQVCPTCGGALTLLVGTPAIGPAPYRVGAVMSDGSRVHGSWGGRESRRNKGRSL